MKKLEKFFNEFIGIENLILIIAILLFLFVCLVIFPSRVKAFEFAGYNQTITIGNNTLYGYDVPTRVNNGTTSPDNFIHVGVVNKNGLRRYQNHVSFINDIGETDLETRWFTPWIKSKWLGSLETSYDNWSIGYHPGSNETANSEMLSNGYSINYNGYYTYSFYVWVESDYTGNTATTLRGGKFSWFTQYANDSWNHYDLNIANNLVVVETIKDESNEKIYKYTISPYYLTSRYAVNRFSDSFVYDSSLGANIRFAGNSFTSPFDNSSNVATNYNYTWGVKSNSGEAYFNYKVRFSEPFDIVLWTSDSGLFCQDTCWTQQQTDNSNYDETEDFESQENNLIRSLFNFRFFDDMGLSGVISHMFDKIRYYFASNYNDGCYAYNINLFNKNISLMCGYNFWTRNDIALFINSIWNVFWTALVGWWVARAMYLHVINLIDVDTNVEVNVKDVSRL